MRYDDFIKKVSPFQVFGDDLLNTLGWSKGACALQLNRWTKSGKLIRLKRGLYTLPDSKGKRLFSVEWLANRIYSPSYLSLDFVLSWYDLIPEKVTVVTSVSVLKTASFKNSFGQFEYRNLKKELFFGFEEKKDAFQNSILMATPEKALLDFFYFYKGLEFSASFLEQGLRLQQLDQLKKSRLKKYAVQFESKKISRITEILLERIGS